MQCHAIPRMEEREPNWSAVVVNANTRTHCTGHLKFETTLAMKCKQQNTRFRTHWHSVCSSTHFGYLQNWLTWPIKWCSKVLEHNTFIAEPNRTNTNRMAFPCKMLKKGVPFPHHSSFSFLFLSRVYVFACDAKLHLFSYILSQIAIKTVCSTGHSPFLLQHFIIDALSVSSLSFSVLFFSLWLLFAVRILSLSCAFLLHKAGKNANSHILWIFILCSPRESFTSHTKNTSHGKKQKNNHDFNCLRDFRC